MATNFAQMLGLRVPRVRHGSRRRRRHGLPEDDTQGLTQKDIISFQQKEAENEFKKEKEFVGRWTELVFKARESGDVALQKHLLEYGRDYIATLSPGTRTILEPILRSGPFDPMKARMEQYDKTNPAPSLGDFGGEEIAISSKDGVTSLSNEGIPAGMSATTYANYLFAKEDHEAARLHFATKQQRDKRNLLPLDPETGIFAMRNKDGQVSVVNKDDLQMDAFASKYGSTRAEVLQNGGAYGKPIKTVINGVEEEYRPFTSFPDGVTSMKKSSGRTQGQVDEIDRKVANFLSVIKSGDDKLIKKDPLASMVRQQMDSDTPFATSAAPLLEKAFPGYVFVKPSTDATIWSEIVDLIPFTGDRVKGSGPFMQGGIVEDDVDSIKFIQGKREAVRLTNNKVADIIYNEANDAAYDPKDGIYLGSLEDTINKMNQRITKVSLARNKQKEEEEERRSRLEQDDSYSSSSW